MIETGRELAAGGFRQPITTTDELRSIFGEPGAPAVAKQIDHLDDHCREFLARSPFLVMATTNADGTGDAAPKGGPPGFVRVLDRNRLAMGELPGNKRLDNYRNLIANPAIGLLFLIPRVGETLRINGQGYVVRDPEVLEACALDGRRPTVALGVHVVEAFIHCAKALRRSRLWNPDKWPDLDGMTPAARMLAGHIGLDDDDVGSRTAARLEQGYATTMWNPA